MHVFLISSPPPPLQFSEKKVDKYSFCFHLFFPLQFSDEKVDKLQDFLSKMFEGGSACAEDIQPVRSAHLDSVSEKYKTMMRRLKETGDLAVLVSLSS